MHFDFFVLATTTNYSKVKGTVQSPRDETEPKEK